MKVCAKRLNDKKGEKIPVTTFRQHKATGVLHQNNNKLITNVHTHNVLLLKKPLVSLIQYNSCSQLSALSKLKMMNALNRPTYRKLFCLLHSPTKFLQLLNYHTGLYS